MKDVINPVHMQFEQYASDVDDAQTRLHETPDSEWNDTAPVTEHQQAKDLDDLQQQDELLPPKHYDIGQDLGLTTDVDQIVQVQKEMSGNDFRSKMRQFNTAQTNFLNLK